MPRLIDADALMKSIGCEEATKYGNKTTEQRNNSYSTMMMYEIANRIDDAPTIEAEPVRHGRWEKRDGKTWCSLCGASNKAYEPPYCPHCGAKMEEGAGCGTA